MNLRIYRAVGFTGIAQILASAGSHYLPAVTAIPASKDLGLSPATIFAAFSLALCVSAFAGPYVGRLVDRFGGRPVLMMSSVSFAIALTLLGFSQGLISVLIAYAILGFGMACGLFEVAFATIVRLFGKESRNPITGVTLIAGFASLVGWTASVYIESHFGWRGTCWFWAATHILIGLPVNALVPKPNTSATPQPIPQPIPATEAQAVASTSQTPPSTSSTPEGPGKYTGLLLAFVFAASSFVGMGLMTHMPRMLEGIGVPLAVAFAIGAFVGPSQVLGRLLDFFFMRRWHPLISARIAAFAHPVGATLLFIFGAPFAAVFVVLHGLGNGILIISRGTLPLAIFGTRGYGQRQGWLMMPSKFAQAAAPFLFGLAVTEWGSHALWLSAGLGIAIFAALCLISSKYQPD
jgi:MFS family permease